jgi:hypothetical protein
MSAHPTSSQVANGREALDSLDEVLGSLQEMRSKHGIVFFRQEAIEQSAVRIAQQLRSHVGNAPLSEPESPGSDSDISCSTDGAESISDSDEVEDESDSEMDSFIASEDGSAASSDEDSAASSEEDSAASSDDDSAASDGPPSSEEEEVVPVRGHKKGLRPALAPVVGSKRSPPVVVNAVKRPRVEAPSAFDKMKAAQAPKPAIPAPT